MRFKAGDLGEEEFENGNEEQGAPSLCGQVGCGRDGRDKGHH